MARPYQIVVWGASGFTGRLVCEHIAQNYQGKIRWAIAGRNEKKLEGVRSELMEIQELCKDVPVVVADSADQSAVDDMVSSADLVIACAGPYSKYSTSVVDASVRLGTHYCDVTGEVLWVRENINKYHEQAKESQVKIVHGCGFDSIPSDLGTHFVTDHVRKSLNKGCKKVELLVEEIIGTLSGGTLLTILDIFASMNKERYKLIGDPYTLDPPDSRRGNDTTAALLPFYSKNAGCWGSMFEMESINTRVVRRSNALLGNSYGSSFGYSEARKSPNFFSALMQCLKVIAFGLLLSIPAGRALVSKVVPKPGEGPTLEEQYNGRFQYRFVAEPEESTGQPSSIVEARVSHEKNDPGYRATARMVLECALCQIFESEKLKEQGYLDGGILTPASAFGMVAVERLRQIGYNFEVVQSGT